MAKAIRDHRDDQVVGNQLTGLHVGLRFLAQLRSLLDVGAQHVAGRNERHLKVLPQALGLGSLSRSGRTQQDEVELRHEASLYRRGESGDGGIARRKGS